MTKVAEDAGVTWEQLLEELAPHGNPRLSTLVGIMRALGFKLVPTATASAQVEGISHG